MSIYEMRKLEEIHRRSCPDFPFPNLNEPLYAIQEPIYEGGKLVGAGIVHVTSEVILILDKDLGNFQKARAVLEIFSKLRTKVPNNGFTDSHIWSFGEGFDKILKKHFNFQETTGKSLVWNLKNG